MINYVYTALSLYSGLFIVDFYLGLYMQFMKRALEIAALGYVSPNPRVGAVLVRDHHIIAEGYHQNYGGDHAEIELFNSLPADFDYSDTVLYVTLEPCSHYGKTPPCAAKIIALGIPRVIVACTDPNPLVAGRGIQMLKDAGVKVSVGLLQEESQKLNESFFKFISTRKPFVLLKSAMSLDGKICTNIGESKWISSEASRREVHILRSRMSAVMVGVNTVIADDPALNSRIENGRDPIKIIADSTLRTPLDSKALQNNNKTIIATLELNQAKHIPYTDKGVEIITTESKDGKIDLQDLMGKLAAANIDSILLEGGAELAYSALDAGIIDKVQLYYAPILIGGSDSKSFISGEGVQKLSDAFELENCTVRATDRDFVIEAYIKK